LLAAAAVILLLLKVFWLNGYAAPFRGLYDLGLLVEAILASVAASYVFYLIVVHIKEQSDRDVLRPYVEKHSIRVVGDCIAQLQGISKASGVELDLTKLSEARVLDALSAIPPYSQAPLLISAQPMQHANWFQYFAHFEQRSKGSIRKLLDQLRFLEASFVANIADIDDCTHFSLVAFMQARPVGNPDLSAWAKPFYEYCVLCRRLDERNVQQGFKSALA